MMVTLKTIYVGGIFNQNHTIKTFVGTSRPHLVQQLNDWFFDYFHDAQQPPQSLPPLDDWTFAKEDTTFHSIIFPEQGWTVWSRMEIVQFK